MDSTETTAAGPDAGPAPVPRNDQRPPFREQRAFLTEIAIVVIGVLLALGAEQVVQWWIWQDEVKESRAAISEELLYNLGSRKLRDDRYGCIERRLDDLQLWHDSLVAGRPLKPTVPIGQPGARTILFDAWEVAQNGQVAAHIPLKARMQYAKIYGFYRTYLDNQNLDLNRWGELQKFEGAQSLDARSLQELQGLIIMIRTRNHAFKLNWPVFERGTMLAGVPPLKQSPPDRSTPGFCQSLFGKT